MWKRKDVRKVSNRFLCDLFNSDFIARYIQRKRRALANVQELVEVIFFG